MLDEKDASSDLEKEDVGHEKVKRPIRMSDMDTIMEDAETESDLNRR